MNTDGAVFHLATIAVVLASHADGVAAALVSSRFVDGSNGLRVDVIAGNHLLAAVAEQFFIPLDRLKESL